METIAGYVIVAGALAFIVAIWVEGFRRWRWRRKQLMRVMAHHLAQGRAVVARERTQVRLLAERGNWTGYRKFRVTRKTQESDQVVSFYLAPHDGGVLAEFRPGQFLTFRLRMSAGKASLVRCYSLSGLTSENNEYRVTIKREARDDPAEAENSVTCFLHDRVHTDSVLDVAPPAGAFTLDQAAGRPVVFIAGGVGITPFLAMSEYLEKHNPEREAWLFYGVTNRDREVMSEQLRHWAERPNFHLVTCYSQPRDATVDECDEQGHIDAELLRRYLPSSNYEFFICAPAAMIRAMADGLREWGVPASSIHMEMFKAQTIQETSRNDPAFENLEPREVTFQSAGKTLRWTPESGTVLDLATTNDVFLPSGCRAGSCGTCATPIMRGAFHYLSKPEFPVAKDSCLVCIAVPTEDTEFA